MARLCVHCTKRGADPLTSKSRLLVDYRRPREQYMSTCFAPFVPLPCQASAAKVRPVVDTCNPVAKVRENEAWPMGGRSSDELEVLLTKSRVR